jgi:hypothetical protein
MTPELIEACRIDPTTAMIHRQELTELALDGLRFRIWCECASTQPGLLAGLIARCGSPLEYRAAIDQFIIQRRK